MVRRKSVNSWDNKEVPRVSKKHKDARSGRGQILIYSFGNDINLRGKRRKGKGAQEVPIGFRTTITTSIQTRVAGANAPEKIYHLKDSEFIYSKKMVVPATRSLDLCKPQESKFSVDVISISRKQRPGSWGRPQTLADMSIQGELLNGCEDQNRAQSSCRGKGRDCRHPSRQELLCHCRCRCRAMDRILSDGDENWFGNGVKSVVIAIKHDSREEFRHQFVKPRVIMDHEGSTVWDAMDGRRALLVGW